MLYTDEIAMSIDRNDKRERLVRSSRDVTMNRKMVIFQVHRQSGTLHGLSCSKYLFAPNQRISKNNKEEVLSKAENDLAVVVSQYIGKLVKNCHGPTSGSSEEPLPSVYRNMLKLQHSVDFARLILYCLAEINDYLLELGDKSVEPLQINVLDYLLGVADLSGELMRPAIGRIYLMEKLNMPKTSVHLYLIYTRGVDPCGASNG